MGINEKCVRWEFATIPIAFNKKLWGYIGKEYFSKSLLSIFKSVMTLIMLTDASFYCMLKVIGMKKTVMTFAYIIFRGAIFYIAPLLYCKWIAIEHRVNKVFWLSSQKPYWMSIIWARWWDKKMAQLLKF